MRKAGPAKSAVRVASQPKPAKAAVPERKAVARTPPAAKAALAPATKPAAKAAAARKPATPAKTAVVAKSTLTEEERIEEAKYLPRDLPKRLFEEERFIFPESYGVTRVRLLVKDPDWLFAHWDVDPKTLASLKGEVGERAMALSRLTLRIADPEQGGQKTILLPPGARSWYVRADGRRARAYVAELGVTLPSGEFRALAESNRVATPRVGPSSEVARERKRVGRSPEPAASGAEAATRGRAGGPRARASQGRQPWRPNPEHQDATREGTSAGGPEQQAAEGSPRAGTSGGRDSGGASDVHRR